jgi:hypothetical protein
VSDRTYPLPAPESDPRFTFGLTYRVAKALEAAGYPLIDGVDFIELQQALYRFLYEVPVLSGEELAAVRADLEAARAEEKTPSGVCLTCGHCFLPGEVPEDGVCGGCLLARAIAERVELCDHEACPQPGMVKTDNGLFCPDHLRDLLVADAVDDTRTLAAQYGYGELTVTRVELVPARAAGEPDFFGDADEDFEFAPISAEDYAHTTNPPTTDTEEAP